MKWPRWILEWDCHEYHLRPEVKMVRELTAVRCLHCGAEHATTDRYERLSAKWLVSFEQKTKRDGEIMRQKIIDEAFHQDPAQAALVAWREEHVK